MKKKKIIANSVMVAAIVMIAAIGILLAGRYRGWFDRDDAARAAASVTRDKGIVDLMRDGIAIHLDTPTTLHDADQISASQGAQATVSFDHGTLILGEDTTIRVEHAMADDFTLTVLAGEVFLRAEKDVAVNLGSQAVSTHSGTAVLSVRTGAETVGVLSGEITVGQHTLPAGQQAVFAINSASAYAPLDITSLSDFFLHCAQDATQTLCFTDEALKQVLADRQVNASVNTSDTQEAHLTCTIAILCDTILDNMDLLATGKDSYVPGNGILLAPTTVSFTDGDSVFDVLKRTCDAYGIQLEYSYTPAYNSYYVEGINHLYEFDCGNESGWMYQVNSQFPNYGCSDYTVEPGDAIVWCYTCCGLGADVGGGMD